SGAGRKGGRDSHEFWVLSKVAEGALMDPKCKLLLRTTSSYRKNLDMKIADRLWREAGGISNRSGDMGKAATRPPLDPLPRKHGAWPGLRKYAPPPLESRARGPDDDEPAVSGSCAGAWGSGRRCWAPGRGAVGRWGRANRGSSNRSGRDRRPGSRWAGRGSSSASDRGRGCRSGAGAAPARDRSRSG